MSWLKDALKGVGKGLKFVGNAVATVTGGGGSPNLSGSAPVGSPFAGGFIPMPKSGTLFSQSLPGSSIVAPKDKTGLLNVDNILNKVNDIAGTVGNIIGVGQATKNLIKGTDGEVYQAGKDNTNLIDKGSETVKNLIGDKPIVTVGTEVELSPQIKFLAFGALGLLAYSIFTKGRR